MNKNKQKFGDSRILPRTSPTEFGSGSGFQMFGTGFPGLGFRV